MQGATTKLGYIYPLVIPNGERPHGFGIPASAIDLRQGLRLMSLIFKTQSGRGCVNVTRGSLSKAYAHTQPDIIRCLGMEGRRRIVVPSTPIHDPITKRVSRYNRSRDPYLTLPYLTLGGPTTDPFFGSWADISLINESRDSSSQLFTPI